MIDPVAGTIYVVAKTYENSAAVNRLRGLDGPTGLEKTGFPMVIAGSYMYKGKNNVFGDLTQVNRPGLLLENGYVYPAFGSNGCRGSYEEGWVMSYNTSTLQQTGAWDDEPGEAAAAVWMRGGEQLQPTARATSTGRLRTDPSKRLCGLRRVGIQAVAVGHGAATGGLVYTLNELYLDKHDLDMSEPVLVLPTRSGLLRIYLAAVGKEGTIYILNQSNLGHFCSTCTQTDTQIVQELTTALPKGGRCFWNNAIYTSATGAPIAALALTDGVLGRIPFALSKKVDSGHSPVIWATEIHRAFCGSSPATLFLRLTRLPW